MMKISIITVCYNSALTIRDTLASVTAQDYAEFEHIVIDGGSNDGTQKIVKNHEKKVAKFVSEPDGGIYDAMNKGLILATGDIIGFLNADDFLASSETLSWVAKVFADPDVEACYGDLCYVNQKNTSKIVRFWKSSDFHHGAFIDGWSPPHPTFFVRRNIYERLGGFDLSYKIAADFELMLRFLEVHRIRVKYIPDVMVKMRLGGTTNRSLINIIRQNKEIVSALQAHDLRTSFLRLVCKKLVSRGGQFFMRPTSKSV